MYPSNYKPAGHAKVEAVALPAGIEAIKIITLGILVLILLAVLAAPLPAQENQPVMNLSLKEAIQLALQKNFDIQLSAMDTQSAYATLVGSYGIYNFSLTEDLGFSASKARSLTSFRGSDSNNQDLSSTLSRKIFTGASVSTGLTLGRSATNSITSSLNPAFSNSWNLNVTQPILKNFGKLATERQIMINRNTLKIDEQTFETQVINTLVDVESKYWTLVSTYDALTVAEEAVKLALEQLEINKIKVEVGSLPEIEITSAEEGVATREAELVDAQAAVQRAMDQLKQAMVLEDWDVTLVPTEDLREPSGKQYNFESKLKEAYENRPELRQLDLQIANNDINIKYSRNQLRPELNFTALYNLSSDGGTFNANEFAPTPPEGLPLSFWSTLNDVFSGANRNWSVGATFVYTFGNDAARANLKNYNILRRQNLLRIEQTRYSVAVEVRSALRELEISSKQLDARRKALLLSEKQLEVERQKFQVGSSTNFQVLQYQNNLVTARYNVIVAQVRYSNALTELDRATGKLLASRSIDIQTTGEGITGAAIGN